MIGLKFGQYTHTSFWRFSRRLNRNLIDRIPETDCDGLTRSKPVKQIDTHFPLMAEHIERLLGVHRSAKGIDRRGDYPRYERERESWLLK